MATVLLALASAAMYGLSDFIGGIVSRRASVWQVAVVTQMAAVVIVGAAALLGGTRAEPGDLAWGAIAGIGTGTGTAFLYRGLSSGRMGVVAPLSAVGAALIPVATGIVIGERPPLLTWIGIGAAIPAIWLVSTAADPVDVGGRSHSLGEGVVDGLVAGVGFGLMFSALGQVSDRAGLAPLALAEVTSIPSIVLLATVMGHAWVPRQPTAWWGLAVGALAAAAAVLFLLASQSGLLTVAAVLSSLYPVFTVMLAASVLRERIHAPQAIGLVLAVVAVALVAIG
jgi:uncharacterized membrane protein